MARLSSSFTIPEKDLTELTKRLNSRNAPRKDYERAFIVLESSKGRQPTAIAKDLLTYPNKIIEWRNAYLNNGIPGLEDKPKSGRTVSYGPEFRDSVLKKNQRIATCWLWKVGCSIISKRPELQCRCHLATIEKGRNTS